MPRPSQETASDTDSRTEPDWEDLSDADRAPKTPIRRRPARKAKVIAAQKLSTRSPDPVRRSPRSNVQLSPRFKRLREDPQTPKLEPTPSPQPNVARAEAQAYAENFLWWSCRFILQIIGSAISLLRIPLALLLCVSLLAVILGQLSSMLQSTFRPLCILPGTSHWGMCIPHEHKPQQAPQWADYPKLMEVQSNTFEQLLDKSAGGSGLSLDIKKAEMATRDLTTLVRFSDLKSRDSLTESLERFTGNAKATGRGLQKLSSKISGAVDQIIAVNEYGLQSIDPSRAEYTRVGAAVGALIPWTSRPSQGVVVKAFEDSMNVISFSLARLIVEAELQLHNLEHLEEDLLVIHDIVSREEKDMNLARFQLLADLWTILGGNRDTLRGYDNHLVLLKNLGEYRKQALAHVVTALQHLRALSDDMDDIRERVAAPELAQSRIPIEVHMKSIRLGLDRLKDSRIKAKEREDEAVKKILGPGADTIST